jgi:predicted transcriptional regulator
MKEKPTSIRLDERLKKELLHFAKKENRSLSNYILTVLHEHIGRKTGRTGT